MSLTLGEKLRQARESKGLTLSDVSEQTRISSLYLEHIENDDYSILPGGIFNKGFVKSYAKFVGINEQEALFEYSQLTSEAEARKSNELNVYKPEVLTDDRSSQSMIPTAILAIVILGLMTVGILFLLDFLKRNNDSADADSPANAPANTEGQIAIEEPTERPADAVPDMASLKVEFIALTEPVSLLATSDGNTSNDIVPPGNTKMFEPRTTLKLSYSRSLAATVELKINGRKIELPTQPLNPKRSVIEFEINRENLAAIWTSGSISTEVPSASPLPPTNGSVLPINTSTATPTPAAAPAPRPSPSTVPANRQLPAANSTVRATPSPLPRQTVAPASSRPTPTRVNRP